MRFVILLTLVLLGNVASFAQPRPGPQDTILIVGVAPDTFEDGKEAVVEVAVAYDLTSFDQAAIELTANELRAQGFSPVGSTRVQRGTGTVTITGKLTPRYWTSSTPAKIGANLVGADDALAPRKIVAHDDTRITVARRPQPDSDPVNPNPADVYDDNVVIKSISPEILTEGQETTVTVTVAYELLSREAGQINLGFNAGRGNGYTIISSTVIKIGQGEAVLRADLVPVRTGKLPFAKIFVNLSEYPHRPVWSPLAVDSRAVEVK